MQLKPVANGEFRVSSGAFRDKTGEISVHLASLATKERVLLAFSIFSLAEVSADVPRRLGLRVSRDPLPDDDSHALLSPNPSKTKASELAGCCKFVVLQPPANTSAAVPDEG